MPTSDVDVTHHSIFFMRNWFGFFIMGLTTTLPYSVVTTAAYSIVKSYDHVHLLAMVYGVAGSATFLVKVLNAFFLRNVRYGTRFFINSIFILAGIAGVAFATGFTLAMLSIVLVGLGYAFGENIALGYLSSKGFDSDLVNAWASGTGLAGVVGASIYILFGCLFSESNGSLQKEDRWAFLFVSPAVLLYLAASLKIIVAPSPFNSSSSFHHVQTNGPERPPVLEASRVESDDPTQPLLRPESVEAHTGEDISYLLQPSVWRSKWGHYKASLKLVLPLAVNLAFSTFLAYVTRYAASKVRNKGEEYSTCPEIYASLQLCYQAGVFTSKSSLQLYKFINLYPITIMQLFLALVWTVNQHFKFLPIYSLPSLMIIVGLLSGAVYVNTFYKVQTDMKYSEDRELCINITAIFINVGMSVSAILTTLLFKTLLIQD